MATDVSMGYVSSALEKLATAVGKLDATPSPSRKQFVREAAVKFAAAKLSSTTDHMTTSMTDGLAVDAIKLAEQIWDKTQQFQG